MKQPAWLHRHVSRQNGLVIAIIIFAAAGACLQLFSRAAVSTATIEAEGGQLSGNLRLGTEPGSAYVVFGKDSSTGPVPVTFTTYKKSLLDRMTGFAKHAGATGGDAALAPTVVTNTNDSGAGSLRDALSHGGRWIIFDKNVFPPNQEKTITLSSVIQIPDNITIDGRGSQVRVTTTSAFIFNIGRYDGSGCNSPASNIIIHNIKAGPSIGGSQQGDIITINPRSDRIWIDHVEFITPVTDEALSLVSCSTQWDSKPKTPMRATFSYLKFDNFSCSFNPHNYPVMIGDGTFVPGSNPTMAAEHDGIWERQSNPDQPNKVSFHDSYLSNVCYRGPLIYDSRVHIWNNYVNGYTGTALDITNVSNVRYENSVINKAGSSTSEPAIKVRRWSSALNYLPAPRYTNVGSILLGGANEAVSAKDSAPAFTPPYAYTITNTVQNDNGAALLNRLNSSDTSNTGRAGWINTPGY